MSMFDNLLEDARKMIGYVPPGDNFTVRNLFPDILWRQLTFKEQAGLDRAFTDMVSERFRGAIELKRKDSLGVTIYHMRDDIPLSEGDDG